MNAGSELPQDSHCPAQGKGAQGNSPSGAYGKGLFRCHFGKPVIIGTGPNTRSFDSCAVRGRLATMRAMEVWRDESWLIGW